MLSKSRTLLAQLVGMAILMTSVSFPVVLSAATISGTLKTTAGKPIRAALTIHDLSTARVRDDQGDNAAVSDGYALSAISQANLVWQQASVQFTYKPPIRYINSTAYLNPMSDAQRAALTTQLPGTGAFTVYYVGFCTGPKVCGQNLINGLIVCRQNFVNHNFPEAVNTILAHELGHAQGLCHVTSPQINLMNTGEPSVLQADITISQANNLSTTPTVCEP